MGYLKSDRKIENPFLWACLLSYGLTQPNSPRRAEWPTAKVYSDRLQKCTLQFIILGSKINGVFFSWTSLGLGAWPILGSTLELLYRMTMCPCHCRNLLWGQRWWLIYLFLSNLYHYLVPNLYFHRNGYSMFSSTALLLAAGTWMENWPENYLWEQGSRSVFRGCYLYMKWSPRVADHLFLCHDTTLVKNPYTWAVN